MSCFTDTKWKWKSPKQSNVVTECLKLLMVKVPCNTINTWIKSLKRTGKEEYWYQSTKVNSCIYYWVNNWLCSEFPLTVDIQLFQQAIVLLYSTLPCAMASLNQAMQSLDDSVHFNFCLRYLDLQFNKYVSSFKHQNSHLQSLVLLVLLYAAETWTLSSADKKMLEAFHMKSLLLILGSLGTMHGRSMSGREFYQLRPWCP